MQAKRRTKSSRNQHAEPTKRKNEYCRTAEPRIGREKLQDFQAPGANRPVHT